ncbi:hypothetical protein T11_9276, partial [Trichinella zimbabwensis]
MLLRVVAVQKTGYPIFLPCAIVKASKQDRFSCRLATSSAKPSARRCFRLALFDFKILSGTVAMETLTGFECHQFIQAFSWATCRRIVGLLIVVTEKKHKPLQLYIHEDASCRFIAFRKLGFGTEKGKYRFSTRKKCYEKAAKSSEQLNQVTFSRNAINYRNFVEQSNTETPVTSRHLNTDESVYILFYTRFSFWDILKAEKHFKNEYRRATGRKEKDIPLKVFNNDREVCDVCLMGIFNFHAICRRCG